MGNRTNDLLRLRQQLRAQRSNDLLGPMLPLLLGANPPAPPPGFPGQQPAGPQVNPAIAQLEEQLAAARGRPTGAFQGFADLAAQIPGLRGKPRAQQAGQGIAQLIQGILPFFLNPKEGAAFNRAAQGIEQQNIENKQFDVEQLLAELDRRRRAAQQEQQAKIQEGHLKVSRDRLSLDKDKFERQLDLDAANAEDSAAKDQFNFVTKGLAALRQNIPSIVRAHPDATPEQLKTMLPLLQTDFAQLTGLPNMIDAEKKKLVIEQQDREREIAKEEQLKILREAQIKTETAEAQQFAYLNEARRIASEGGPLAYELIPEAQRFKLRQDADKVAIKVARLEKLKSLMKEDFSRSKLSLDIRQAFEKFGLKVFEGDERQFLLMLQEFSNKELFELSGLTIPVGEAPRLLAGVIDTSDLIAGQQQFIAMIDSVVEVLINNARGTLGQFTVFPKLFEAQLQIHRSLAGVSEGEDDFQSIIDAARNP